MKWLVRIILLALVTVAPAQAQFKNECRLGFCNPSTASAAFATLNGVAANATLSNGNLTAAHSNSSTGGARSASTKTTGKFCWETTLTVIDGVNSDVGLIASNGIYESVPVNGTIVRQIVGQIDAGGGVSGFTLGTLVNGDIITQCADLGASKMWFRKAPSGLWNGNGSADPATGVNGVNLNWIAGFGFPAEPYINFMGTSAEIFTANFGQSAFSSSIPSGFTAGWTP